MPTRTPAVGKARPQRASATPATDACCAQPDAGEVAAPDDETLARMAKAIAHPARLAILRLLADRNTCMTGDLVTELPLAQSTVSEHLRILREAGLVQGEIEGPRTGYCTNPVGLARLKAGVAAF